MTENQSGSSITENKIRDERIQRFGEKGTQIIRARQYKVGGKFNMKKEKRERPEYLRRTDHRFFLAFCNGVIPKQPSLDNGCARCGEKIARILHGFHDYLQCYLNYEYSEPIRNGESPPENTNPLHWMHVMCFAKLREEKIQKGIGHLQDIQAGQELKRKVNRCSNSSCQRTTDNTPVTHFEWDHVNVFDKLATISSLLAVKDELFPGDFEFELSKCQLLCKDCHDAKTKTDKALTLKRKQSCQISRTSRKISESENDAAKAKFPLVRRIYEDIARKQRNNAQEDAEMIKKLRIKFEERESKRIKTN